MTLHHVREGYIDAACGLSFCDGYDQMPEAEAKDYSEGRLLALNMRAAGMCPPDWPSGPAGIPRPVVEAAQLAAARVGHADPFYGAACLPPAMR